MDEDNATVVSAVLEEESEKEGASISKDHDKVMDTIRALLFEAACSQRRVHVCVRAYVHSSVGIHCLRVQQPKLIRKRHREKSSSLGSIDVKSNGLDLPSCRTHDGRVVARSWAAKGVWVFVLQYSFWRQAKCLCRT